MWVVGVCFGVLCVCVVGCIGEFVCVGVCGVCVDGFVLVWVCLGVGVVVCF
jgi:hypothetical protein